MSEKENKTAVSSVRTLIHIPNFFNKMNISLSIINLKIWCLHTNMTILEIKDNK